MAGTEGWVEETIWVKTKGLDIEGSIMACRQYVDLMGVTFDCWW